MRRLTRCKKLCVLKRVCNSAWSCGDDIKYNTPRGSGRLWCRNGTQLTIKLMCKYVGQFSVCQANLHA
jgi:hypothetical protein